MAMVASLYLGLLGSLAQVGAVLGVEKQKLDAGKDLIKYFSVSCKATKTNGGRTRNLPEHDLEKWQQFVAYNKRDVETEMEILERVNLFPVPDFLWKQYAEDQRINDLGIEPDMDLVGQAIKCDEESRARYLKRAQQITGLDNPNSPIQLKEWILSKGVKMDSLAKAEVAAVMDTVTGEVREGEPDRILNRPYRTSIYVPELATGNRVMAFGDYSYYWIADRQGRSFKRLNELFATTGQVGFLASERVDGKLILSEAVKTLDVKASAK